MILETLMTLSTISIFCPAFQDFQVIERFVDEKSPAGRLIRGFVSLPLLFCHFSSGTFPFILFLIVPFLPSDILNISFSILELNVLFWFRVRN